MLDAPNILSSSIYNDTISIKLSEDQNYSVNLDLFRNILHFKLRITMSMSSLRAMAVSFGSTKLEI